MKKLKTKDIREVIKYDGDIVVDEYNYYDLYVLYGYYLRYMDTKLTYNDIDLKVYAKSHKHGKGNPEREEKWEELVDKEINRIKKMIFKSYFISLLILAGALVGLENHDIHEEINLSNSSYILDNYAKDIDGDGIKELLIDELDSYKFSEPTSNLLYKVTNPFYYLSDNNIIANAYTIREAAKEENIKILKYDGNFYTNSGSLSFATYEKDGSRYLLNIPYSFESKEQAEEIIAYFLDNENIKGYEDIDYIATIDTKTYDELPTIYQSKSDNSITTKEPSKTLIKYKQHLK